MQNIVKVDFTKPKALRLTDRVLLRDVWEALGKPRGDYSTWVTSKLTHYEKGSDFQTRKSEALNFLGKKLETTDHIATVQVVLEIVANGHGQTGHIVRRFFGECLRLLNVMCPDSVPSHTLPNTLRNSREGSSLKQRNSGDSYSQEYFTPTWLFNRLNARFQFTLDPASCAAADKGIPYFTKEDNGLVQDWTGQAVFCNPPFNLSKEFLEKCVNSELRPSVFFVAVRPDTHYWHTDVWPHATDILFFKGRSKFENAEGGTYRNAQFPTCLVGFHGATFEYFTDLGVSLYSRASTKVPNSAQLRV